MSSTGPPADAKQAQAAALAELEAATKRKRNSDMNVVSRLPLHRVHSLGSRRTGENRGGHLRLRGELPRRDCSFGRQHHQGK